MNVVPPRSPHTLSHVELVEAAILAPSPDNNQPWRFISEGDQLLVYLDPQRALPSDVNAMFDLTGLGSAIENACIAARQMGYEPHVDCGLIPIDSIDDDVPRLAATITFTPGGTPDPLHPHLATRCTCRKLYSTRLVAESCLSKLADAAREFSEVRLDWVTDRARIRAFARLIAVSDRIRFEYEPFHNELFRQLRFSVEDAERTQDGLDLRTLELPPGAGALLRQLRPWHRMKWIHRLGLGRLLTLPSAWSVWKSGALGVLSLSEPTATCFLRGGRAFQRIWLTAQAEGLALQPLGSLSIFFAHLDVLHGRKLSDRHKHLIRRLIGRFGELVPAARERVLLMLFRLGNSAPPRFRSLRRPAEDVLDDPLSRQ